MSFGGAPAPPTGRRSSASTVPCWRSPARRWWRSTVRSPPPRRMAPQQVSQRSTPWHRMPASPNTSPIGPPAPSFWYAPAISLRRNRPTSRRSASKPTRRSAASFSNAAQGCAATRPTDPGLRADFDIGKEEGNLLRGVLRRVGAVHRIRFDRLGEILTNRAGGGLGGIGRAHHFAVFRDRVLAFEHLDDDRARNHRPNQGA